MAVLSLNLLMKSYCLYITKLVLGALSAQVPVWELHHNQYNACNLQIVLITNDAPMHFVCSRATTNCAPSQVSSLRGEPKLRSEAIFPAPRQSKIPLRGNKKSAPRQFFPLRGNFFPLRGKKKTKKINQLGVDNAKKKGHGRKSRKIFDLWNQHKSGISCEFL